MFMVGEDGDVGVYVGNGKVVFCDEWDDIDHLNDNLQGYCSIVSIYRVVDKVGSLSDLTQQRLEETATLVWQYESDEDKEKRMKKEALEEQMKKLQQEMDKVTERLRQQIDDLSQQISAL